MKTTCLTLLLLLTVLITHAQQPSNSEAVFNGGEIVTTYDRATDKTNTEFLIMLEGNKAKGLALLGMFAYSGQRLTQSPLATLSFISFDEEKQHEKTEDAFFVIDGKRKYFKLAYALMDGPVGGVVIETLTLPAEFNYDEITELAEAKNVEGQLGSNKKFKFTAQHFSLLQEFARHMKVE